MYFMSGATRIYFMSETKSDRVHSGATGKCPLRRCGEKENNGRCGALKPGVELNLPPESEAKRCVSFCLNATEVSGVEIIPAVNSVTGLPCTLTKEELD